MGTLPQREGGAAMAVQPMGKADWDEFFELIGEDVQDTKVWSCALDTEDVKVWKRPDPKAPINLVRLWAKIPGVKASLLYDMLNNHAYRKVWDENMIEGKVIEMVSPVDEVGYYAAKAPSPISNRDFCTHRTFKVFDDKYVIFNKSVDTDKCPEDPNFVRGWSFRTGYLMKDFEGGATPEYMTQSDPRGWIPKWVTNSVTSSFAPKIVDKMVNAANEYADWLEKNPDTKPTYAYASHDDK